MRKSIFTLVILLYTETSQLCWANEVVNNLLTYSVNAANEISRKFRLLNEDQDFASQPWNFKTPAGNLLNSIKYGKWIIKIRYPLMEISHKT